MLFWALFFPCAADSPSGSGFHEIPILYRKNILLFITISLRLSHFPRSDTHKLKQERYIVVHASVQGQQAPKEELEGQQGTAE